MNFGLQVSLRTHSNPHITKKIRHIRYLNHYNFLPFFEVIMNVVNVCKKILQHIKEYCQEAGIHGPQHIVSPRLTVFERLVLWRFS